MKPSPEKVSSINSQVASAPTSVKIPKFIKKSKKKKKKEHQGVEMEDGSNLRQGMVHTYELNELWVTKRESNKVWKRKYPS